MAKHPEPDDLDLLSAIWILASNDDNPLITYRGLTFRLGLPNSFDVRAIVRSRPEMFRPGVLPSRLEKWKVQLREGRNVP